MTKEVEAYTVPRNQRELAERRTEFLLNQMTKFDTPLKIALASAYFQGMQDLVEVAQKRLGPRCRTPSGAP